ncbi:Acetyltransferase [Cedecea neteri]|uniref:Acetyltransferase n=1 Tax=Cedecea neteri TaxID=158822 RepID=A0A2X3KXI2_9ENTR|nr:Acetyltransferase [Cedecea neteri]
MPEYRIRSLKACEFADVTAELTDVLIDCVEGGASVSFLHPLSPEKAAAFWGEVGQSVARGERTMIVAEDGQGRIVGTVQFDHQPTGKSARTGPMWPKLLVHRKARRKGIAQRLMAYLEAVATTQGKSVLVLDTATGSDAEKFYQGMGWLRVGDLPNYALMPDGSPCSTTFYYRNL